MFNMFWEIQTGNYKLGLVESVETSFSEQGGVRKVSIGKRLVQKSNKSNVN
jgi:hypothetical protein